MEIHNIKDVSDDILNTLDTLLTSDCQAGKYSLTYLKQIAKNTDILYVFENDIPIYVVLLDIFNTHKTVYIHDVCVATSKRGNTLFKKSLAFLKEHYSKEGFTTFTLDASDSMKEEGFDQKARIRIFHSAGFDIHPETSYFTNSDYKIIKTRVLLDTGDTVEIQKKEGSEYRVKDDKGKEYTILSKQIEKCFDAESNEISCPMYMSLSATGGKRTKKTRRKTKRNMSKT